MKPKLILTITTFIFFHINTYAAVNDSIYINGSFVGYKSIPHVALYAYNSSSAILEKKIINNSVRFALANTIEPGVYYLQFFDDPKSFINIIINGKEKMVRFELRIGNSFNRPVFLESVDNQKWTAYLNETKPRIERLNTLFSFLATFSTQSDDKKVFRSYQKERRQYYRIFSKFINENSNNWPGLMVTNQPYYFSNLRKKPVRRDFLRRESFWEGIDTANPKLINSPLYMQHIDNYLIYIDDNATHHPFSEKEKEVELKKSVSIILDQFSKNEMTKNFVKKYLLQKPLIQKSSPVVDYVVNY